MARPTLDQNLTPSVLDRLIDKEPRVSSEPPAARSAQLSGLKEAVKRDLEWLLNTKQPIVRLPAGRNELERSLLAYGLPDFTTASLSTNRDQDRLRRTIQQA